MTDTGLELGELTPIEITPTDWGTKLREVADELDKQIAYCGDEIAAVTVARGPLGRLVAMVVTEGYEDDDEY